MMPCTKEKEIEEIKDHLSKSGDLLARIDERQKNHDRFLKSINKQTKITNGRVSKLEKWRTMITGVSVGINAVLAAALAMVAIISKFL